MKNILTLIAVACCWVTMTVLTACTDDDTYPVPPEEQMSAVDNGIWPVPDDAGDASVKPGDDFFMSYTGGFWKNTTLDEDKAEICGLMQTDVMQLMKQRTATVTMPSMAKMKADVAIRDNVTLTKQQQRINADLARVEAVQTKEDAWKLTANLMKEGYSTMFNLTPFSHNGRMVVCLTPKVTTEFSAPALLPEDDIAWQLHNDPDLLACMTPLYSSATRGIDATQWPMLATIFETLGVAADDAYVTGDNPYYIIHNTAEMMNNMFANLQKQSADEWKTSLQSIINNDAALFNDESLEQINAQKAKPITRENILDNISNMYLRYEKSKVFADAYLTADMKQRTTDICEELLSTFRQRIKDNTWMSQESKRNAIEKVDAMILNVGYPDEWMKEGLPDLSTCETILDDVHAVRCSLIALDLHLIGMNTAKVNFHDVIANVMDFTVVNASYSPNSNSMNIWPVWMMEPLYNPQYNEAWNYAVFLTIGHEMTHGFDTNGARYNKIGDMEDIWANDADHQEFLRRAQLLADCYSRFEVMPWALPGLHNDGNFTITEDIADLGGFHIAYDAYVSHLLANGFKGEQLDLQRKRFYLAYVWLWHSKYTAKYAQKLTSGTDAKGTGKDIHSLPRERVNGNVMNTDDWYELFDVKEGDKFYLSPENRVRIW